MSSDARITVNGHIFAAFFFHYVLKICFFSASAEPFLLYRSESWTLTTAPEKQLDNCYTRQVVDQPAQQAFPIELLRESQSGSIPFFFAHVPTFLGELARKRLLRRLVADPGEGPGGAGPPSSQGLDGRAPLLKVRLDPALKAATCCSKHQPERSYI